ncbi:hypothetical protein J6590_016329 [Homalodisca vitripennis]|nr:hypothetical protein J6590_016329 [Homalodisca vitripennis]
MSQSYIEKICWTPPQWKVSDYYQSESVVPVPCRGSVLFGLLAGLEHTHGTYYCCLTLLLLEPTHQSESVVPVSVVVACYSDCLLDYYQSESVVPVSCRGSLLLGLLAGLEHTHGTYYCCLTLLLLELQDYYQSESVVPVSCRGSVLLGLLTGLEHTRYLLLLSYTLVTLTAGLLPVRVRGSGAVSW